MANLFLSFLGTSNYLPCTYSLGDLEGKNVRFVQEALARIFCKQWKGDDRIIVFTTDDAITKNWRDGGHKDEEGNPYEGLETRLSSLGLQCEIRKVMIPEGHTAEDIWLIFNQVCAQINESDTVFFDITHLQAARWCLEHNLIQQAYTILQETVVSMVLCQVEKLPVSNHSLERRKRTLVTEASALMAQKKPLAEARQEDGTEELWPLVWDFLGERGVGRQLDRMRNRRNDLNHAGINDHPADSSSFKKDLKEMLEWFENL